jgi:hypothetical protein
MSKLKIVDLSFCDSQITSLDDNLKGGKGNSSFDLDDIFSNFDFPILPANSTPSPSDSDSDSDSIGYQGSVSANSSSLSAFISKF